MKCPFRSEYDVNEAFQDRRYVQYRCLSGSQREPRIHFPRCRRPVPQGPGGGIGGQTLQAEEAELEIIRKQIPIVLLPDYINAAGNNILVNDHGAVVNPDFPDSILKQLEELFGVEVVRSAIAGCNTIGSLCKCNNKGCVCTIDATDDDVELLKEVLKVQEVQRTTVNHGSKYVGSGVIANSKGALVGDATTPIEMGRLEDGLVLY